jgi:D-amino-acid oxidase
MPSARNGAQFRSATDYSWRRFQIMVGEDYGIRWLPTYSEGEPEDRVLPTFPPAMRALAPAEHPFPFAQVYRFDTLYIEPGRYLRQLMRDISLRGGTFAVRRFDTARDIATLQEQLVFNCTGLGARALFDDMDLRPARGQLAILLPQPEIGYAYNSSAGYMFPRPDGIVLGGTFQVGNWSLEADPATTDRILASHRKLFAGTG